MPTIRTGVITPAGYEQTAAVRGSTAGVGAPKVEGTGRWGDWRLRGREYYDVTRPGMRGTGAAFGSAKWTAAGRAAYDFWKQQQAETAARSATAAEETRQALAGATLPPPGEPELSTQATERQRLLTQPTGGIAKPQPGISSLAPPSGVPSLSELQARPEMSAAELGDYYWKLRNIPRGAY